LQHNLHIRAILDVTTIDWGVQATLVELKDIQLPDSVERAMASQAQAEREKRAKIIAAEVNSWPVPSWATPRTPGAPPSCFRHR
jgi:regulator of protease activity HflC (stomatin/prohibitin superfamily)